MAEGPRLEVAGNGAFPPHPVRPRSNAVHGRVLVTAGALEVAGTAGDTDRVSRENVRDVGHLYVRRERRRHLIREVCISQLYQGILSNEMNFFRYV